MSISVALKSFLRIVFLLETQKLYKVWVAGLDLGGVRGLDLLIFNVDHRYQSSSLILRCLVIAHALFNILHFRSLGVLVGNFQSDEITDPEFYDYYHFPFLYKRGIS